MPPITDRRALRTLHFALCAGCAIFLVVAAYVVHLKGTQPSAVEPIPALSWAGYVALALVPLAWAILAQRVRHLGRSTEAESLNALRAALIVHWALIESACFFNGIVFLVTGSWVAYGLAWAVLVVLLYSMPTDRRIDAWLVGAQ